MDNTNQNVTKLAISIMSSLKKKNDKRVIINKSSMYKVGLINLEYPTSLIIYKFHIAM